MAEERSITLAEAAKLAAELRRQTQFLREHSSTEFYRQTTGAARGMIEVRMEMSGQENILDAAIELASSVKRTFPDGDSACGGVAANWVLAAALDMIEEKDNAPSADA